MTEPTPGEWEVDPADDCPYCDSKEWRFINIMTGDSYGMSTVALVPVGPDYPRAEQDAALIASAPSLAEENERLRGLLRDASDRLRKCIVSSGSDPEMADIAVAEYRAALAQAEEEQPPA